MSYLLKKEERADHQVKKARAYVYSNLIGRADDWYLENKVYGLKFKSKAWAKVSRFVNRKVNQAIMDHVEGVTGSVYSKNAGCTCGCSPGYILDGLNYMSLDLNIEFGNEDLDLLQDCLDEADDILKEEILAYKEEEMKQEVYA